MILMHSQINRAISSAISDRFIPEIQDIMGLLSSGQRTLNPERLLKFKILAERQTG